MGINLQGMDVVVLSLPKNIAGNGVFLDMKRINHSLPDIAWFAYSDWEENHKGPPNSGTEIQTH